MSQATFQPATDWQRLQTFLFVGLWLAFLTLLNFFAGACDVSQMPQDWTLLLAAFLIGCVISQIVLLGALLAWFPAGFLFRVILFCLVSSLWIAWLMLGAILFAPSFVNRLNMMPVRTLPALFLSLAAPFEVARHLLRIQVKADWIDLPTRESQAVNVATLLKVTAVIAVAFSLLSADGDLGATQQNYTVVVVGLLGSLALLPVSLVILRSKYRWLWLFASSFLYAGAAFALIQIIEWYLGDADWWPKISFAVMIGSICFAHGLNMICLVWLGVRLEKQGENTT